MEMRTIIFLIVGSLAACVGGLMLLIAAFRRSVLWGLAVLFVPLANLVYTVRHWAEAKKGFFVSLAGGALIVVGLATSPSARMVLAQLESLQAAGLPLAAANFSRQANEPAPSFDAQIQQQRDKVEQLEARFAHDGKLLVQEFNALTGQRKLLKSSDEAAVGAFNHAVAEYQTHNTARQVAKDELAALRLELETLLNERSRQRTTAATPSGKTVVIYSTASCPACVMAKSYFKRKGVPFDERDVNTSPAARAEFEKLGGRGVPLILVGTERMEGFSQRRLDQLL